MARTTRQQSPSPAAPPDDVPEFGTATDEARTEGGGDGADATLVPAPAASEAPAPDAVDAASAAMDAPAASLMPEAVGSPPSDGVIYDYYSAAPIVPDALPGASLLVAPASAAVLEWLMRVDAALPGLGLGPGDVLALNEITRRIVTSDGRKIEIA